MTFAHDPHTAQAYLLGCLMEEFLHLRHLGHSPERGVLVVWVGRPLWKVNRILGQAGSSFPGSLWPILPLYQTRPWLREGPYLVLPHLETPPSLFGTQIDPTHSSEPPCAQMLLFFESHRCLQLSVSPRAPSIRGSEPTA